MIQLIAIDSVEPLHIFRGGLDLVPFSDPVLDLVIPFRACILLPRLHSSTTIESVSIIAFILIPAPQASHSPTAFVF